MGVLGVYLKLYCFLILTLQMATQSTTEPNWNWCQKCIYHEPPLQKDVMSMKLHHSKFTVEADIFLPAMSVRQTATMREGFRSKAIGQLV